MGRAKSWGLRYLGIGDEVNLGALGRIEKQRHMILDLGL